jgi:hypothetical protein
MRNTRHALLAQPIGRMLFSVALRLLLIPIFLSGFPHISFASCRTGYAQCSAGYCCPWGDRCANDTRACISPGSVYCGGGRSCPAGNECYDYGMKCGTPCTYGRAGDGYCLGSLGTVYCGNGRSCPAGNECYDNGLRCRAPQSAACPMGYGQCPSGYCCPSGDRCANDTRACIAPGLVYCGAGRTCPAGNECYDNGMQCRAPQTAQTFNKAIDTLGGAANGIAGVTGGNTLDNQGNKGGPWNSGSGNVSNNLGNEGGAGNSVAGASDSQGSGVSCRDRVEQNMIQAIQDAEQCGANRDLLASIQSGNPLPFNFEQYRSECSTPLSIHSQRDAFDGCARTYTCGAFAFQCALAKIDAGEVDCTAAENLCLQTNPIPH